MLRGARAPLGFGARAGLAGSPVAARPNTPARRFAAGHAMTEGVEAQTGLVASSLATPPRNCVVGEPTLAARRETH